MNAGSCATLLVVAIAASLVLAETPQHNNELVGSTAGRIACLSRPPDCGFDEADVVVVAVVYLSTLTHDHAIVVFNETASLTYLYLSYAAFCKQHFIESWHVFISLLLHR